MMRRTIIIALLLGLTCIARGQTEYDYRYWFDNAADIGTAGFHGADTWQQEVDVSNLTPTLHRIHLALTDEDGHISSTMSQLFYKVIPEQMTMANHVIYWYDSNTDGSKTSTVVNGTFTIDGADLLSAGLHKLTAIISNTKGDQTSVATTLFYIPFIRTVEKYTGLHYWFDNDSRQHINTKADGLYTLDISKLKPGIHTIHFQTDNLYMSPAVTQLFYKMPYVKNTEVPLKCLIHVDGKQVIDQHMAYPGELVQVDVSQLSVGIHTLSVMTMSDDNDAQPLAAQSAIFYYGGLPGAENPTGYVYWFDNDTQHQFETLKSGIVTLQAGTLSSGLHSVHIATNGAYTSPVATQLFYVKPNYNDNYTLHFWTDDAVGTFREYILVDNDLMQIDVDDLALGDHTVRAMLVDSNGNPMSIDSQPFTTVEPILGDANIDRDIDVADIVTVVNYITGRKPAVFSKRGADINQDGNINVADIVNIIRIMAGTFESEARPLRSASADDHGQLTGELTDDALSLNLWNNIDYTAFQMTLTLPDGIEAEQISLSDKRSTNHVLNKCVMDDSRLMVMVYSMDNSSLRGQSGELLSMVLSQIPKDKILVDGIIFVTPQGRQHQMSSLAIGQTTGINEVPQLQPQPDVLYDLGGRPVKGYPAKGIYIRNGQKVMMK